MRDHYAIRLEDAGARELLRRLAGELEAIDPVAGVRRTNAGDERLSRRLAELEHVATRMAEAEGDD